MKSKEETPLFDALIKHREKESLSFHVPGHKNGRIFNHLGKHIFDPVLSIDLTELTGLDDLHDPGGPILEAEQLLADLYGSQKSYFLVNGTTSGNIAMILAACEEGDTVLVQRNCHKSVLHGLMLANVKPVFISPVIDEQLEIAGSVTVSAVKEAIGLYPETKAIVLTYPTYYGTGSAVSEIISLAHQHSIPVLVDEAHGAHFCLGAPFPESALAAGADVVVHSAHKTLPAMTMGSFLHYSSELIDSSKLEFSLQMLQSSSPSYPIMASLDLSRAYLATYSQDDIEALKQAVDGFKEELNSISGIHVAESKKGNSDLLKLIIRSEKGHSGFQLQQILESEGIFTELADARNVLMVFPLIKKDSDFPFRETLMRVERAVKNSEEDEGHVSSGSHFQEQTIQPLALTYQEMKKRQRKLTALNDCLGEISAEMITPYPPGIPLIMPGEKVTAGKIKSMEELLRKGGRFHGGPDLESGQLWIYE
ncbi:aminotransferase class I/II-fold pyridoxal phosphate-dependent enzyme [Actinomycetes bacterium NPDC127524]